MTTEEFSNTFDTILNSFGDLGGISLDEYEKSVFLTQAQEQLVVELYTGRTALGSSFEDSEEFRSYLRPLIKTVRLSPKDSDEQGLSKNSKFFHLPEDLLFITYESAVLGEDAGCKEGENITVVPTTQDDYARVSENPFKRANLRRALRLDLSDGDIEVVSKYDIQVYIVRYLRRPLPIITTSLAEEELSINGYNTIMECELEPMLHRPILDRAVLLAIQSKKAYSK